MWLLQAGAQAQNPPPEQSAWQDARNAHWVEVSRNGDAWVSAKDGTFFALDTI